MCQPPESPRPVGKLASVVLTAHPPGGRCAAGEVLGEADCIVSGDTDKSKKKFSLVMKTICCIISL